MGVADLEAYAVFDGCGKSFPWEDEEAGACHVEAYDGDGGGGLAGEGKGLRGCGAQRQDIVVGKEGGEARIVGGCMEVEEEAG